MKKRNAMTALLLTVLLLLTACGEPAPADGAASSTENVSNTQAEINTDYFSDRDLENSYDTQGAALIRLNGSSAECSSHDVQISGSTVTITREGTYILTGTLEDGMIVVDTDKGEKVRLVLDGVKIHSAASAPIYIRQTDKVFLTTAEGMENTLSNGGSFVPFDENDIDAVIFSKEDLTLNGMGTLTIISPGGHGVVSKDSLTIAGGSYDISSAGHALVGKDDVCVTGANLTLTAGKDGIHAENKDDAALGYVYIGSGSFAISAQGDGISAGSFLTIDGGSFDIVAGGGSVNGEEKASDNWGNFMGGPGGRGQGGPMGGPGGPGGIGNRPDDAVAEEDSTSMKGIKADGELAIYAGSFVIDSADDAIHSNTNIVIHGGSYTLSTGDDAMHGEDSLLIRGGQVSIPTCYEGLEAYEVCIEGGAFDIHASDDGINAAGGTDASGINGGRDGKFGGGFMGDTGGNIEIAGGTLTICAGGDGLDSNGTLTMSGGYVYVVNPSAGDTSVLDSAQKPVITGGTYIGLGASQMMAESFSTDSPQGVIACTVGSQPAGAQIRITDEAGNEILAIEAEYDFVLMIVSTPDIQKNTVYQITVDSLSGEITSG